MATITCPRCGKVNADGNTFCIGCGQKLEPPTADSSEDPADVLVCPQCGKANRLGNLYCIGCGAALSDASGLSAQEQADVCPQCGKPFLQSDSFCVFCGTQLGQSSAQGQATVPSQPVRPLPAMQQPSRPKDGKMRGETSVPAWMIIAISALVIILAALLLFVVFRPSGNSSTTQTSTTSTTAATSSESSTSPTSNSSASEAAVSTSASSATAQNGDYVLADSSTRYYARAELEKLSTLDLYHARNEIYARHGRGFKNDDLRTYFSSKSWYHETVRPEAFNEGELNECEKQNVNLMLEIERSRNSPYLS